MAKPPVYQKPNMKPQDQPVAQTQAAVEGNNTAYLERQGIAPIVEQILEGTTTPRSKSDTVLIFEERVQAYIKAWDPRVAKTPVGMGQAQGSFIYTIQSLWRMPVEDFSACMDYLKEAFQGNPKTFSEGTLFAYMEQVTNVGAEHRNQHYALMNLMLNGFNPKVVLREVVDINLATRGLPENASEYLSAYFGLQ